jgi:general nucleoside transport system permease protein
MSAGLLSLAASALTLGTFVMVLRIAVPYLLCALGGTLSERGGVINIGLEGTLLVGAFAAVAGAHATGSSAAALAIGVGAGVALQGLYAVAVIRFRADQIVAGVAVNLLAVGATRFFLKLWFDSSANSPRVAALPPTGALAVMVVALPAIAHLLLFHTRFGLRLRACGEVPLAAATAGISVPRLRTAGVLWAGALGGLAGVWLASLQHQFVDQMSGGRGFIALAAMIFGRWRPFGVLCACLLFGAAETAQIALQTSGVGAPPALAQTLPYVLTLVALAGAIGRSRPPAALGQPWSSE